jgi:uncharacterized membrane protein YobD (UPF0266 family)
MNEFHQIKIEYIEELKKMFKKKSFFFYKQIVNYKEYNVLNPYNLKENDNKALKAKQRISIPVGESNRQSSPAYKPKPSDINDLVYKRRNIN